MDLLIEIGWSYKFCLLFAIKQQGRCYFSDSFDISIKFWVQQNEWKCSQTITEHNYYVRGLSLNEQQNRVISCGSDKLILVIEQSEQCNQWSVIQKIQLEQYGIRICFLIIIHSLSTFIERIYTYYEMNSSNKQFIKTKDI